MVFDLFKRKKTCMELEIYEQSEIAQKILDAYLDSTGNIIAQDMQQNCSVQFQKLKQVQSIQANFC